MKPSFFIVGAPKCGTTSLYAYLRSHPLAFLPEIKEPHYFASDFPGLRLVDSEDAYLKLFSDAPPTCLASGEASACYLYSQAAIGAVREFAPQAKLLVMLRNPVDLAYSFHSELHYSYHEDQADFEVAWRLQERREQQLSIPSSCAEAKLLQYGAVARIGEQVERLLQCFPRQQIHLVFYDELSQATRQTYEEVLAFLGLPSDGRENFARTNANKVHTNRTLARLLMRPPFPLDVALRMTKNLLRLNNRGLAERWLAREAKRPAMKPQMRRELTEFFREDVRLLERLTRRDLGHWLEGAGPAAAATNGTEQSGRPRAA